MCSARLRERGLLGQERSRLRGHPAATHQHSEQCYREAGSSRRWEDKRQGGITENERDLDVI